MFTVLSLWWSHARVPFWQFFLIDVACSQNRAEYERRVREQALKFRDQSMA